MDGVSSSDDGLVVAVHHAVSVQVGIARVAGLRILLRDKGCYAVAQYTPLEVLIFVGAFIDIAVHHTNRHTHLRDVIRAGVLLVEAGVGEHRALPLCQGEYFVFIESDVERHIPCEILHLHRLCVE